MTHFLILKFGAFVHDIPLPLGLYVISEWPLSLLILTSHASNRSAVSLASILPSHPRWRLSGLLTAAVGLWASSLVSLYFR